MAMSGQLHAPAALLPQVELSELTDGWWMVDGVQQDNISLLSVTDPAFNHVSCVYFNTAAAFLTMLFQETKMHNLYASFLLHA